MIAELAISFQIRAAPYTDTTSRNHKMPRREPADVFYATDDTPAPTPTPAPPETAPSKPHSPKKPPPEPKPTPPGPHRLELRINDRAMLRQRIYNYEIDQQDDHLTITGNLRPNNDEPK